MNINTKCLVKYVGLSVGGSSNMTTKCQAKYVSFSVGCSSEQEHKMSSNMNSVMFSLTKFSYTSSIIVRTVNLGIKKEVTTK